jgi:hypothetical protein
MARIRNGEATRDRLANRRNGFEEGFDTPDLVAAKGLLAAHPTIHKRRGTSG